MSRTIIDITQLVNWQGRLTGIPRIMDELASHFQADDSLETRFIIWRDKAFEHADYQPAATVKLAKLPITSPAVSATFVPAAKRMVAKLPLVGRLAGRLSRPWGKWRQIAAPRPPAYIPESTDKLLIIWGEWADVAYTEALVAFAGRDQVKLFQVVNDIIPIVLPQFAGHSTQQMKQYLKRIVPISHKILCISEHTKQDVAGWLTRQGLKLPPTEVFRLGDDFGGSKHSQAPSKSIVQVLQPGFLLSVGTVESRKNHNLLYYVYRLAASRGIQLPKLVIAGRPGWKTENLADFLQQDPVVNQQIIWLQDASDSQLNWLYDHAKLTIYPSFYEGWGLPIAESIAHGTPCLASRSSSMTEVAGDLISYFDPQSSDECLAAIVNLLRPAELKKARQKLKRYQTTSWQQTYDAVKLLMEA